MSLVSSTVYKYAEALADGTLDSVATAPEPHTDTEKIPHMFGTLIIALPSAHTGGELLIRHAGEEVAVSFCPKINQPEFQHSAFFSDCEHEVTPVTDGYRVCLTFNLAFKNKPQAGLNQDYTEFLPALTPILQKLKDELTNQQNPLRAILLTHQYTEENFSL